MNNKILLLFDMDGTLTKSRSKISPEMSKALWGLWKRANQYYDFGIVSGSDIDKIKEQIGHDFILFDYVCPENGCAFYNKGALEGCLSIAYKLGEDLLQKIINKCLFELSQIELPKKRGNFIELRNSLINISPIGRSCSKEEREEFVKYDKKHKVRELLINKLTQQFSEYSENGFTMSIGGEISIDIAPVGWNKAYCLNYLDKFNFRQIRFYGDKTHKGGNDYEIFTHPKVTGKTIKSPEELIQVLNNLK